MVRAGNGNARLGGRASGAATGDDPIGQNADASVGGAFELRLTALPHQLVSGDVTRVGTVSGLNPSRCVHQRRGKDFRVGTHSWTCRR